MRFPRVAPYETHAIGDDGTRKRIETYELVLERPVGVDLEINLAPHPGLAGSITFSTFRGSSLLMEGGAADCLYLFVEDWPVGDRRRKSARRHSRTPVGHVYAVDASGQKTAIADRTFVVRVAPRCDLEIDLAPPAPWAKHVRVQSPNGRQLVVSLGAANVVQVSVAGRVQPRRA